jgi:hypothetical protein
MGNEGNFRSQTPVTKEQVQERVRKARELPNGGTSVVEIQLAAGDDMTYPAAGTGGSDALSALFLALNGAVGKASHLYTNVLIHKNGRGDNDDREAILDALGSVIKYTALLVDELDASLEDVATQAVGILD